MFRLQGAERGQMLGLLQAAAAVQAQYQALLAQIAEREGLPDDVVFDQQQLAFVPAPKGEG
jgi:hypothetical protein